MFSEGESLRGAVVCRAGLGTQIWWWGGCSGPATGFHAVSFQTHETWEMEAEQVASGRPGEGRVLAWRVQQGEGGLTGR